MKKMLMATAATALTATAAFAASHAQEAKIGVILGFTGPIESLTPMMAGPETMRGGVKSASRLVSNPSVTLALKFPAGSTALTVA